MSPRPDASAQPAEGERLLRLRSRLLASTGGAVAHVPARDAEDVVQEAMIRFLKEPPREGSPSDEVRAHVALKRERANYYRRRSRRPEALAGEPVALLAGGSDPDARLVQAAVAIEQIAGRDARLVAELRGQRQTYEDIAGELGWRKQRVEAARKQLERHKDQIAAAVAIQLKEVPDGQ
jgi:DNA-directed RNA polymerase specialized sigma24 family protein